MNILLNRFPDKVSIQEVDYVIHTDFRIGIQFEMMMLQSSLSDMDKIVQSLALYYPIYPQDIMKAMEQVLWFYNCGESFKNNENKKSSGSNEQIFSYEQDQYMIYTAFLLYYQIDLNEIEYLHWWKFKQLFNELPDEAKIKKVMMYRSIHINSNMSKEQKQFYADMKSIYRLKNTQNEKNKANNFGAILANGMILPNEMKE
ncbi:bacteriophage Gp15 family protein [Amedibacillus sp. YH-ame6]